MDRAGADEDLRRRLEAWWRARHGGAGDELRLVGRPSSGWSGDTVFADVAGADGPRPLAIRLAPVGQGMFPSYDLARETAVQTALGRGGVPVAPHVATETDTQWLGRPFSVSGRVQGRVVSSNAPFLTEGWLAAAVPEEQTRVLLGFLDTLAAIHRLAPEDAGIGGPEDVGACVARWRAYLDWADGGAGLAPPVVAAAFSWCAAHRPEPAAAPSLLWGDPQLANAVFAPDGNVAAVLDFELASVGPAELDVGWYLALHAMTAARCGADLPGFPDRVATVAAYEARLGRPLADLAWYEAFAVARTAAVLTRAAALLVAAGVPGGRRLAEENPAVDILGALVG